MALETRSLHVKSNAILDGAGLEHLLNSKLKTLSPEKVLIESDNSGFLVFAEGVDLKEVVKRALGFTYQGEIVMFTNVTGSQVITLTDLYNGGKGAKGGAVSGGKANLDELMQMLLTLGQEDKKKLAGALGFVAPSGDQGNASVGSTTGGVTGNQVGGGFAGTGVIAVNQSPSYFPKLSSFSGDNTCKDTSYEQWRFEVRSLMSDNALSESLILQAIRRSLRGLAAEILLHLGENVSLAGILVKLDQMFGNVETSEVVLERFYQAKQKEGESLVTWACRLEDYMVQLQRLQGSTFSLQFKAQSLRAKFFKGLQSNDLKAALRHRFDGGETYEQLLVAARAQELEHGGRSVKLAQVASSQEPWREAIDKLTKSLTEVLGKVTELEKRTRSSQQNKGNQVQSPSNGGSGQNSSNGQQKFRCYRCQEWGHMKRDCPLNGDQPGTGGSHR